MADPARSADVETARRFLTFRMDRRLYALPAEEVAEVIRMPAVARIPQGPKSLLGVANLRGAVLPVASLRGLLGCEAAGDEALPRAIVLDGAAPVALAVDVVEALVAVEPARLETRQVELAAEPGERLRGAFQVGGHGQEVAKILDLQTLLAAAFAPRARPERQARVASVLRAGDEAAEATADRRRLVTFEAAGQEFALELDAVREIIPAPEIVTAVPDGEALVLGVAGYRDSLLPLLSLRGLLGLPVATAPSSLEKVVVTVVGGVVVGLVVDRMRAIVPAAPGLIDPTPPVLAARAGGEARIKAIYRGDAGRRLISILAPEQLFREDVMQRLGQAHGGSGANTETAGEAAGETRLFLVFRLGEDEFGLPIEAVDEVAEAPTQITRLPKTPKFLEGVVNLRGEVLPVVDQRRRFDMAPLPGGVRRRMVVVRTARHRAGLLVDSVSEVLRSAADAIEPAPDLTGEATRLVNGVINLEQAGRLVMVLDPAELLSRAERGLLDAFAAKAGRADL